LVKGLEERLVDTSRKVHIIGTRSGAGATAGSGILRKARNSPREREMAIIKIVCDCGQKLSVPAQMAGKKGRCPKCKNLVSVPMTGNLADRELKDLDDLVGKSLLQSSEGGVNAGRQRSECSSSREPDHHPQPSNVSGNPSDASDHDFWNSGEHVEHKQVQESLIRCPRCLSTQLTANRKGFGVGKALVGGLLLGGVGLLGGFVGSNKVRSTCLKCGHQFLPGEGE
jgi:hypothetical protein